MELELSQASPSLSALNNKLYVAFLGQSSDEIYVCSSTDGLNWSSTSAETVGETSGHPPSLCKDTFNNKLWMAFCGQTTSDVLVASYDGTNWSPPVVTGQTTSTSPALAVFQGKLWVAFLAQNASHDIYLCSSSDGKTWSPATLIPGQSSAAAPSLAVFNNRLWIAFLAQNGSDEILVYSSADAKTWVASPPNQLSLFAPALSTHGGALWLSFTGKTTSDVFVCSSNGSQWSANATTGQTSQAGPTLFDFNGSLKLAFLSYDKSDRLFIISSQDGKTWSPATQIGNFPTQVTLTAGGPSDTIHFGSGVNEAQFYASVVMYSNGSCIFNGTYTNNGTLPGITAPPQAYAVSCVVLANGRAYTFNHSATCQNANHDSWYLTAQNPSVEANWPAIAEGASSFKGVNDVSLGAILSAVVPALGTLVSDASQVAEIAEDAIAVIGP